MKAVNPTHPTQQESWDRGTMIFPGGKDGSVEFEVTDVTLQHGTYRATFEGVARSYPASAYSFAPANDNGHRACVLRHLETGRQMDVELHFEDSRDYHTNQGRFGKPAWAIVEDAPANDNEPTLIPRDTPEAAHYAAAVAKLAEVVEPQRLEVMERLLVLQDVCHGLAAKAGWWMDMEDGVDVRTWPKKHFDNWVAAKLMLTVTEVAEAMEGHRKGLKDDKLPHRDMREVELADAVIRIFDLAGGLNYDLAGAIIEKLVFNMHRPDHKLENRKAAGGKSV